jgi:hypothetical protein
MDSLVDQLRPSATCRRWFASTCFRPPQAPAALLRSAVDSSGRFQREDALESVSVPEVGNGISCKQSGASADPPQTEAWCRYIPPPIAVQVPVFLSVRYPFAGLPSAPPEAIPVGMAFLLPRPLSAN